MSARFIAFEGGEGCGKSTQAALLAQRIDALLAREPGGTTLGARIRDLVLGHHGAAVGDRAETLLIAADRAQHVAEVVRPALAAGRHVVTDRYVGSSLAYQGVGRGLGVDDVRHLSEWATGGLYPDAVVLIDVPGDIAALRRARDLDRMESAGDEFHRRVVEGYRSLARSETGWVIVDGDAPADEVERRTWAALEGMLGPEWA